jgi:hypothetical protein
MRRSKCSTWAIPANPRLLSTFEVGEQDSPFSGPDVRIGAHQFRECMTDTLVYATWFGAGLRIIDLADPERPREVAYFIPEPGTGKTAPATNDVAMDDRGLLYITDKATAFDVIEFTG